MLQGMGTKDLPKSFMDSKIESTVAIQEGARPTVPKLTLQST
jgi:hypothetical protein